MAAILAVLTINNVLMAQDNSLYEKNLPNGNRLYLSKQSKTETKTTELTVVEADGSHSKKDTEEEYIVNTYILYLTGPTASNVVWEKVIGYAKNMKDLIAYTGELNLWDIFFYEDKAYVLYAELGDTKVDNIQKGVTGSWIKKSSTIIAKQSGARRVFKGIFLQTSGPQISLEVLGSDQKTHNEIWTLKGDKWKRK